MGFINESITWLAKDSSVPLPFTVKLQNSPLPLTAQKALRFVPHTRITVLARWGDGDVVAKLFFHPQRSRKHFYRELAGLKSYEGSQVLSPTILYSGTVESSGIPIIILEYLKEGSSLQNLYKAQNTFQEKLALLLPPIHALAQLHHHGFYHNDLHFGNFLMETQRCFMIDGDGVQAISNNAPLRLSLSLKNLAQWCAQLSLSDYDLLDELYTAYARGRHWADAHTMHEAFLSEVARMRSKRLMTYGKKIMGNCSAIECKKQWDWRITWRREYGSITFLNTLATVDTLMDSKKSQYLKKGNTCTVAKIPVEKHTWVIKRFNIKNRCHGLKRGFSRSRASKCWRNGHLMDLLGIPVQPPLAFLERRWGPFRRQSYYISEYVEGQDLFSYAQQHLHDETSLRALCETMGSLLNQFHKARITHGDMKATNFIVSEKGNVTVIDLDSVVFHKSEKHFQRAWEKDMHRFMKNWETTPILKACFKKAIPVIKDIG